MANMSFRTFLQLLALVGLAYCSDEFRVISGRRAVIQEFPYHAEIQKRKSHWCGGSIIHELFILTAAHCFFKRKDLEPVRFYKVMVGNDELLRGGSTYNIRQFIVHENYDNLAEMDQFDIALVELMQPLRFSDRVQPVSLAQETPKPGKMGWVIGFGKTNPRQIGSSKYLMTVELPVVSLNYCRRILTIVADDMICAGKKKGTGDACKGDSGGPYVVEDELVGLVAWGIGCGTEGMPGVYTNVAYYKEWIKSKVTEHSESILY